MKIGFAYNRKPDTCDDDRFAEYETDETITSVETVLAEFATVYHYPCDNTVAGRLAAEMPDIVFNIAEGWGAGRDRESFVPAICGSLGIPYTGSDATALGITMDKVLTKCLAKSAGVTVCEHLILDAVPTEMPSFGFPAFLKPLCEGSSMGIFGDSLVREMSSYRKKADSLLMTYNQPVLVEPYLDGRDFCVGILGQSKVLKTCEVCLGHVDDIPFFSHEYKRLDRDRLDFSPNVAECVIEEMEQAALTLWSVLNLRDYTRFDFRTDSEGQPFLLEINALPGLSPVSGIFVRQSEASGYLYSDVIKKILERVLEKYSIIQEERR